MNKLLPVGFAVSLACAAPALASSTFDGTWKGDVKASQLPRKPDVLLLNVGTFTCSTCAPSYSVAADGAFHPMTGSPYYDEMAITVVDPMTVKRQTRKGGRMMTDLTTVVAPDGKTAMVKWTDMSAPNGVPMTGQGMDERMAMGLRGAHALSGSWRPTNNAQISDAALTYTMAMDGDTMRYTTPVGVSYAAKLDGSLAPVTGDPGWTQVTLRRTGPNTLVETDMRDGKPISITTMTVSGGTMTMRSNDLLHGRTGTYVARKQ